MARVTRSRILNQYRKEVLKYGGTEEQFQQLVEIAKIKSESKVWEFFEALSYELDLWVLFAIRERQA